MRPGLVEVRQSVAPVDGAVAALVGPGGGGVLGSDLKVTTEPLT